MNRKVQRSESFTGHPLAGGVAIAPAFVLFTPHLRTGEVFRDSSLTACGPMQTDAEIEKFESSVRQIVLQLRESLKRLPAKSNAASILESHVAMASDPLLRKGVIQRISSGTAAGKAIWDEIHEWTHRLETIEDEYMKSRTVDFLDVRDRLIAALLGTSHDLLMSLDEPVILVVDELTPNIAVELDPTIVKGILTTKGSETSHGAILARSSGIPAISGLVDIGACIQTGDLIAMDGSTGEVAVRPTDSLREMWEQREKESLQTLAELELWKERRAVTRDGKLMNVAVNISTPEEAYRHLELGCDGIGLFRTEFLYVNRDSWPSEDEQVAAYSQVARLYGDSPVILRTLDAGGDKKLPLLESHEENPFLGYRAVRVSLSQPKEFMVQLRAMYRAAKMGNVWILFPMIQSIQEWRQVKQMAENARKQVDGPRVKLGLMMETPAAAVLADLFMQEADFCSIGTNDLTQYTLAVDRMNLQVSHLYDAFHPAVLRLVHSIIVASKKHKKWVGVCGEFAGDPLAIPWLLAQGVDEVSMSAGRILAAKRTISEIDLDYWSGLASRVLEFGTSAEVIEFLKKQIKKSFN